MEKSLGKKIVRTTAWSEGPGCHGGCGMKLYIEDNRLVKVEGDEDCPGIRGVPALRALPLRRVGIQRK